MTIQEVKQKWIQEINEGFAKINIKIEEGSVMRVYDASKERGMLRKLWLCGECSDNKERYFYMYITKKGELKKYNGTVYANTRKDFEEDIRDYKFLGKVI